VCPVLPVSLDCPFLNRASVFSNFYLNLLDPLLLSFFCH